MTDIERLARAGCITSPARAPGSSLRRVALMWYITGLMVGIVIGGFVMWTATVWYDGTRVRCVGSSSYPLGCSPAHRRPVPIIHQANAAPRRGLQEGGVHRVD